MLGGLRRGGVVVLATLVAACSPGVTEPVTPPGSSAAAVLLLSASLTQDSRDSARHRIAVVVRNEGAVEVVPSAIDYGDPRLSASLVASRLRAIPAGGERRFPLPLVEPVCAGPAAGPGLLSVRVGSEEVVVVTEDEVGVVGRWVGLRCAELDVAAVAPLTFTEVRVAPGGGTADLVLTATPTGEGSSAYVIESVAGTPVLKSAGDRWAPDVEVSATGPPVEVLLPAQPARCDGHVFGESAGATSFLATVLLHGERREVLVRMSPEVAAAALEFAIDVCRAA